VARDADSEHTGDDEIESITHSFVLKVWLEECRQLTGSATWRGYITHVSSGTRRYVKDLDGIVIFITSYLQAIGIQPSYAYRLRRWVHRQLFRLMRRQ
jgi:hypothetical protein